jgi:hypothetical protein
VDDAADKLLCGAQRLEVRPGRRWDDAMVSITCSETSLNI